MRGKLSFATQCFFSLKVLIDASLTEVSGKRRLVDVHHSGIFGKLSFLVQHYSALKVDYDPGRSTWWRC